MRWHKRRKRESNEMDANGDEEFVRMREREMIT
jgi:hypothetical protein